jgi:hypothetical protein
MLINLKNMEMKKYIYLIILISGLIFTGCEKKVSTEDPSRITYYVVFELEGEGLVTVPLGGTYTEPGYTAMEGETDVTADVVVTTDLDESSLGVYTVMYAAENVDGFVAGTERTVIVYDPSAPADDFSGSYLTDIVRTESDGSNPRPYAGACNISKIAQGIFYVDCLLGGTYSIGYGYGPAYAMTGYIALNGDNTLSLLSSYVAGWGDGLEGFQNGEYDPGTGLLYWESIYASGDIYAVTLN